MDGSAVVGAGLRNPDELMMLTIFVDLRSDWASKLDDIKLLDLLTDVLEFRSGGASEELKW